MGLGESGPPNWCVLTLEFFVVFGRLDRGRVVKDMASTFRSGITLIFLIAGLLVLIDRGSLPYEIVYFEKIRVFKAGKSFSLRGQQAVEYYSMG